MSEPAERPRDHVVVALPDLPDRDRIGELPATVEVLRIPTDDGPVPDLSRAHMIVPVAHVREPLYELLAAGGHLQVVQTLSAGFEWLVGRVPERVTVCNAKGVFDRPVAEWVLAAILAMQRGLIRARDAQASASWAEFDPEEVSGSRAVILGYGSIGAAVADRLRAFDVEVMGVARTRRDGVLGFEDLDTALPGADILVDLLPVTSETTGLVDARRLALLPDGALVVNAGRGRTIVTSAIVEELRAGRLRAALDVTDPEPLPADHPLWGLPNVLISPHVAGNSAAASVRMFELIGDQVRRFAAGQPLRNEVPRYLLE